MPRDSVTTVMTLSATDYSLSESLSVSEFFSRRRVLGQLKRSRLFRYQRLSATEISLGDISFRDWIFSCGWWYGCREILVSEIMNRRGFFPAITYPRLIFQSRIIAAKSRENNALSATDSLKKNHSQIVTANSTNFPLHFFTIRDWLFSLVADSQTKMHGFRSLSTTENFNRG